MDSDNDSEHDLDKLAKLIKKVFSGDWSGATGRNEKSSKNEHELDRLGHGLKRQLEDDWTDPLQNNYHEEEAGDEYDSPKSEQTQEVTPKKQVNITTNKIKIFRPKRVSIEKYLEQNDRILARKSAIEAFNKQPHTTRKYSSVAQDIVDALVNHTLLTDIPSETREQETLYNRFSKLQGDFDNIYSRNRTEVASRASKTYRKKKVIFIMAASVIVLGLAGLVLSGPIKDEITIKTANPTMIKLAQESGMSRKAELIFLRTKPQLVTSSQMASDCSENTAANNSNGFVEQGCYDPKINRIYILRMPSELYNVEVSTAAYEMLHPVYISIYNSGSGSALDNAIETNYQSINDAFLNSQVSNFAITEPGDTDLELFSLLGTNYSNLTQNLANYYQPYFDNIEETIAANDQVTQLFQSDLGQLNQLTSSMNTYYNAAITAISDANTEYGYSVSWADAGYQSEDDYYYNIYSQDFNIFSQDRTDFINTANQYNQILQTYNYLVAEYNGQQFNQANTNTIQSQQQQSQ